jgi:hypothetical protein
MSLRIGVGRQLVTQRLVNLGSLHARFPHSISSNDESLFSSLSATTYGKSSILALALKLDPLLRLFQSLS